MQGTIQLKYSKDGGATFSTAFDVKAKILQVFPRSVKDKASSFEEMTDDFIVNGAIARMMVRIEFDIDQFDPTMNPSTANTLYVKVCDVRCASIVHLYTAADVNGYSYWTASNNTNYLTVDDAPDVVFEPTAPSRLRNIAVTLMMCKSRALP